MTGQPGDPLAFPPHAGHAMPIAAFCAILLSSLVVALVSGRGNARDDAKDFFVASGKFGGFLVFFLSAGESYSVGSILGFPAGVIANGTSFAVWFLGYIVLAYPVAYFLSPALWTMGRRYDAVTVADLFGAHFGHRGLELVVAISSILFLIPMGVMQFTGFLVAFHGLGWPIPPSAAVCGAAVLTFAYVIVSGIRAPAYVSIIKDILLLAAIVVVGAVSLRAIGHLPPQARHAPAVLSTPLSPRQMRFDISTILLQAVGFCLVPQAFAFNFTSRSARIVRRTQIIMPLYLVMFPFLIAVASFAIQSRVAAGTPNEVFVAVAGALLPGALSGIVIAAVTLAALVVSAAACLTIGALVSRNLLHGLSDGRQRQGARIVIAIYLLCSVAGTQFANGVMTTLNTMLYLGVPQLLPCVICMLGRVAVPPPFLAAGIVAGDMTAMSLYWAGIAVGGVNVGWVGLLANGLVVLAGKGFAWLHSRGTVRIPGIALPEHEGGIRPE
ncbi:sodium:solute symporter family protein [Gluconacetobacter aggeris]|nr:sodium:solute symporter [Gluconacetobacter aggeris]